MVLAAALAMCRFFICCPPEPAYRNFIAVIPITSSFSTCSYAWLYTHCPLHFTAHSSGDETWPDKGNIDWAADVAPLKPMLLPAAPPCLHSAILHPQTDGGNFCRRAQSVAHGIIKETDCEQRKHEHFTTKFSSRRLAATNGGHPTVVAMLSQK